MGRIKRLRIGNKVLGIKLMVMKPIFTWGFSSFATKHDLRLFKRGKYWEARHFPFFDFDTKSLYRIRNFAETYRCGYDLEYAILQTSNGYHLIFLDHMMWRGCLELMFVAVNYGLDTMFFRISALRGFAVLRYGSKGKKPKPKLIECTDMWSWNWFIKSRAKFLVMYETTNW